MEVILPAHSPDMDFDFNSARTSPCTSAPSTPKRFGNYYLSAPTSPSHLSQLYRDFQDFDTHGKSAAAAAVPFSWEVKPGTPKSKTGGERDFVDFAFDVGEECETASLSAEELFDGGMIKPLQIPSGHGGRKKEKDDSFSTERGRERDRVVSSFPSSSSRRSTRSVSPLRVSRYPWEEEQEKQQSHSNLSPSSSSKGLIKKWRLRDFFLFRSASEGRASEKDPLKKYTAAVCKGGSFRGDKDGSLSRRRRGQVSAHEIHYTINKAISEDLKKKTFLPYKQGILGRLAFNPAVHALANGFGFSRK